MTVENHVSGNETTKKLENKISQGNLELKDIKEIIGKPKQREQLKKSFEKIPEDSKNKLITSLKSSLGNDFKRSDIAKTYTVQIIGKLENKYNGKLDGSWGQETEQAFKDVFGDKKADGVGKGKGGNLNVKYNDVKKGEVLAKELKPKQVLEDNGIKGMEGLKYSDIIQTTKEGKILIKAKNDVTINSDFNQEEFEKTIINLIEQKGIEMNVNGKNYKIESENFKLLNNESKEMIFKIAYFKNINYDQEKFLEKFEVKLEEKEKPVQKLADKKDPKEIIYSDRNKGYIPKEKLANNDENLTNKMVEKLRNGKYSGKELFFSKSDKEIREWKEVPLNENDLKKITARGIEIPEEKIGGLKKSLSDSIDKLKIVDSYGNEIDKKPLEDLKNKIKQKINNMNNESDFGKIEKKLKDLSYIKGDPMQIKGTSTDGKTQGIMDIFNLLSAGFEYLSTNKSISEKEIKAIFDIKD